MCWSDLEAMAHVAALRAIPDLFHSGKHMRCTLRNCVIPWKIHSYLSVADPPPPLAQSKELWINFYFQVYKIMLHMEMQNVQIICTNRKHVLEELERKYTFCLVLWQKLRESERGLIFMIKKFLI